MEIEFLIFRAVASCSVVVGYRAAGSSETLVSNNQTIRRHNPEKTRILIPMQLMSKLHGPRSSFVPKH